MNEWQIAAAALLLGLVPCLWVCARRPFADGLVALQLGGTLASVAALCVAEGEARQPFGDLALVLAAVSFAGTLLLARYLGESRERP
jgi:multicomponent Na+:H+ antiporter subunit F